MAQCGQLHLWESCFLSITPSARNPLFRSADASGKSFRGFWSKSSKSPKPLQIYRVLVIVVEMGGEIQVTYTRHSPLETKASVGFSIYFHFALNKKKSSNPKVHSLHQKIHFLTTCLLEKKVRIFYQSSPYHVYTEIKIFFHRRS